mmetsp:Transcript_57824/g.100836  ORF Transcript_57824/g.100836 Transcript_57824/m.100836 type:complete len:151 (-) Transcript_57824:41-493(-)
MRGCYMGQELTMRTKHRGAVRRRFFTVFSIKQQARTALDSMSLIPEEPLPPGVLSEISGAALPESAAPGKGDNSRAVLGRTGEDGDWKTVGELHSTSRNVGLCMLRSNHSLNWASDFKESPLPVGTQLSIGDECLALRAPPYAFLSELSE